MTQMTSLRFSILPTVSFTAEGAKANPASAHLEGYYKGITKDGTLQYGFYDGTARTFNEFVAIAMDPKPRSF